MNKELIAIVGISCRFPGATNYDQFWQNLEQGINSITEIPQQRWPIEKYYSPNPEIPQTTISKWGGLMQSVDKFDAQFFGISPREAQRMDPQQRIMLELSWSCLEDAGYSPWELSGSQMGVFIGVCNYDYNQLQHQDEKSIEGHTATGTYTCIIPNRISYFFNFHGPSVPVDTACSSSLIALHQAVNAIKEEECSMALVGGVSVLCAPSSYISFSQLGMLSPTGQCKTFDGKADGYVRGEGAGVILLKPLAKAIEDNNYIYGVIKGSAINHGGKARTLTSPNVYAQAQVLRTAYGKANIAPNTVSYIETHGTGTPLGDPIEINALKRSFKQLHQQYELPVSEQPHCGLGTVKTNIGHLEAAAGIAGVIKVLLAMKHRKLPKIVNFEQLNPRIELEGSPFYIVRETQDWQQLKTETGEVIPRRAGVSSFGFGGVNAHVVLEEAPVQDKRESFSDRSSHLLSLSAETEQALEELVSRYQNHLEIHPELELADVCYTANLGRAHFSHRLGIIATNPQELTQKLQQHTVGEEVAGVFSGELPKSNSYPKVAFLFTGQGSQYENMGRQLYETQHTFRQVLDECDELLRPYLEYPVLKVLYPQEAQQSNSSLLNQTAYTQPALFALEYALFKLWESWGIKPNVVLGHSVGEYVAATVAGVWSLEDGLKLIAARGRLMQKLPAGGEMVSVMASESKVQETLKAMSLGEQVAIAAINGPQSIVISGESEAVKAIATNLESTGIKTKQLQVSHAFHSPLMEPMLAEFEAVAKEITYHQPRIPLVSNVTGKLVKEEISTPQYWVNHVRQPVRFAQSMKTLDEQGYELFLEIGPKPILLGMGRQCLPEDVGVWLPSLRPGVEEWQQMLSSLGQLYVQGAKVDWLGFYQNYAHQKVALPTYPFQRERYWLDTSGSQERNTVYGGSSLVVKLLNQGNIEGLTQELNLSEQLTVDEQKLLPKLLTALIDQHQKYFSIEDDVVGDYYDELASFINEEAILNYIPLPGVIPDFSWILFFANFQTQEKYQKLASIAQQEIRNIGWKKVNFSSCYKVLDIGCGHGTDLIALAQEHNHLELCGYTISGQQVELGNQKIKQLNLEQRIIIINGDSSQDEFPDNYDLVYGFEVACHISKKEELFSNIRNHLNNEGYLVLSDFISNASFSIDYDAHSSYLITQQEWLELLSKNHLKLIDYVDISNEIANGLNDPNFENNLNYVCQTCNLNKNARLGLQSYDNLYKMLRKGLVSYVILKAQKQENLSVAEIYQWNQQILQTPLHYSDVSLQQLFYGVEWQKAGTQQQQKKQLQAKSWIIFSDRDGVGKRLKNILEKRGDRCFMVFIGETYKPKETGVWELNPSNPGDFERFCQEVMINAQDVNWEIIHLWSLETTSSQQLTQSALEEAQKWGCGSVLHLVQAVVKHLNSTLAQLWLITRDSQPVLPPTKELAIAQTPLWGLGRVISLEHPELWGGLVDLDPESPANEAEMLLQLLGDDQEEDQLAFRHGEIYVARLKRKLLAESQPVSLREHGSYLITGGTGALGLSLAQWLVENGCRYLVLTSRTQPSQQAKMIIDSLQQQGVQVVVAQADVSVQEDMERVLEQVKEAMPPLKGVIHAAGVVGFQPLHKLQLSELEAILRPKVLGGWLLHQLTEKLELDFFVNFSSIASVWGSKEQAHYAAANHFLDGLTYYRQSLGLPSCSINWGPWTGGGMATREARNWLNKMGVKPLKAEKAITAFGKVLASNGFQTVVADINWDLFKQVYEAGGKKLFLEEITVDYATGATKKTKDDRLLEKLKSTSQQEREEMLTTHVQKEAARVLGMKVNQIDVNTSLTKMGLDSLMSIELRNRIQTELAVDVAINKLIAGITVAALSNEINQQITKSDRTDNNIKENNWIEVEL